ncbi:hypothetical protein BH10ACI3_BH10ACI3_20580 [soil metagenome]
MDDESKPTTINRYNRRKWHRIATVLLGLAAALVFNIWIAVWLANDAPDDGRLYAQMASNIVAHGVFSAESQVPFTPTLIRLPGYPFFLAAVYSVFGDGNNYAVRLIQGGIYTAACFLAALIASSWAGGSKRRRRKAARWTFILAAFCPFTAIFSATILTETLTMFFFAAIILGATYAIKANSGVRATAWWILTGLAAGIAVMLRPDSGLFALGIGLSIVVTGIWFRPLELSRGGHFFAVFRKGVVFSAAFILVLAPWTIRNELVFGVFQPLAPAHAEMPGEFVPHGYFLWLRTWIDDSRYIGPMLWGLEENPIDITKLPASAFSSEEERSQVSALIDQYNNSNPDRPKADEKAGDDTATDDKGDSGENDSSDADTSDSDAEQADANENFDLKISPEVDDAFRVIAERRIAAEPIRFYVGLSAKRAASMWFDTHSDMFPFGGELLPLTELDTEKSQEIWLPLFMALDWLYTITACGGLIILLLIRAPRSKLWLFLVLAVSLPRIGFFGTMENPEPRYLVELFIPAAILGGILLSRVRLKRRNGSVGIDLSYGN